MNLFSWAGVYTALVTPFIGKEIDVEAFDRLVERQITAGISGLVPVGTTGEAATLDEAETDMVIRRTVRLAGGRVPVVAGAGANDTTRAVAKARAAEMAGADALLVVTPYYNKPSQAGLEGHYSQIAEATGLPIMLYSVPSRCGIEIAVDTCARLAERHRTIIGIKEAGGAPLRVSELRRACGADFVIHSGDDGLTLPFLSLGARGVTSVVANYAPAEMAAMVAAWQVGETALALALHDKLFGLMEGFFIESNPGPVKAALAGAGLAREDMRPPLAGLLAESRARLGVVMSEFGQPQATRTAARVGAVG